MKAYRGDDGCLRLFRPDRNMARMLSSAKRASLPPFDANEMIKCIKRLIQVDREWVPYSTTSSLYIRPTFIATDVNLCFVYIQSMMKYVNKTFLVVLHNSLLSVSPVRTRHYSTLSFVLLVRISHQVSNLFHYWLILSTCDLGLVDVVP